ncbi:hypothetical protein EV368DRAFT_75106 [Lentinula lateritia]|uniref:Uncharacterized protein n=1 Tax=Lentinula aff. lateritia TaxID=2804960 RepID=A0ACC1TS20_9AGAR|nr:hypothetical protein F5876DRAFT_90630 [Lentinula aff. lateritia]KAJ3850473.1 hypothetical protein EV368DRAFT_75106 [Lentinula lateritia]
MHLHVITLLLSFWLTPSFALHESDAGVVDWHKRLVGVPNTETIHTSPTFHSDSTRKRDSNVVLTATKSNVLAALHPLNGTVEWRYVYEPQDNIVTFQKQDSVVASLSGPGGATLRSFNVLNGAMLLERRLHEPETGLLIQPNNLGTFIAFGKQSNQIYTLTNGATGKSQILYSTISASDDALYVVGLESSFASYVLHVTALSPITGQVISSSTIPSHISNGLDDFLVLSRTIVWIENGKIKCFVLSPLLKGKTTVLQDASFKKLLDIGLGSHGLFIALKDGSGHIVSCDGDLVPVRNFEGPASEVSYAGGLSKDGHPYVAGLHWSPNSEVVTVEIYSPELASPVIEYSLPFDANTHGSISHVAIESATDVIGRLFLTTTTGAIQVWEQDKHIWTREEGLSELKAAKFVELPERLSVLGGEGRSEEGFVGRLIRQAKDVKDLPNYIIRFAKRFATGSYESATSSATFSAASSSALKLPYRDAFGFRQVLVVSTSYGKVYGIDTSSGDILWNRVLGIGQGPVANAVPLGDKIFIMKTVGDADINSEAGPEVVILAKSRVEENVLLFHLDALTGQDILQPSTFVELLHGSIHDTYMLQLSGTKIIVLLDSELKVHLYPDNAESRELFSNATALSVPLRITSSQGHRRLVGHQFSAKPNFNGQPEYFAFPTWTLSLHEGDDVQAIVNPIRDPVASIGKVLGNRTTLYKYLNPHVVLVLTAPHSSTALTLNAHCGLYLVDSVKGSVVYEATLPTEGNVCNVKATFTENWLIYHYYDNEYEDIGHTKGYKVVTVELYEGKTIDDKTRSSELSSYSDKMMEYTTYEQSFVYPHAISAITLTSTKFGISSKDVIFANANGKIQSFSRRLLNPRRPIGRKPSSEEQEEFLIQYDPLLPDDSRKVISHNYDVAHIRSITTSPALLESTSLVFAYGLDLFLTRVAPSNTFDVLNESFNKVQLVVTVMGLAVAILVTRPIVMRKKLREKWYS